MSDGFDTTVRVRVPRKLKARLKAIADAKTKLEAEVSREALVQFVEREEAKVGNGDGVHPAVEERVA